MSGTSEKPRVRVAARSGPLTTDTFVNFAANLGYGSANLTSASTYGFNPISRNRQILEWMYRGSWLVRKMIDAPAEDMTREGVDLQSVLPPDRLSVVNERVGELQVWQRLCETLKWARLYGGALGILMIDGDDPETPLRIETVGKGQFRGILVADRWMLNPTTSDLVSELGQDFLTPKHYSLTPDVTGTRNFRRYHHTRCVRFTGVDLPYWQKLAENYWGLSILEPIYDRMIAFDSATAGAAQLIYKAHLRVLKLPKYREKIAMGGVPLQAMQKMIEMIRLMQSNEGLTVIDQEDDFQANQYAFSGLSDMMIQFSQQVSGGADVPMTRLFGQSPAGMNATGESDLRNYYDGCKSQQVIKLARPVKLIYELIHRDRFGEPLPDGVEIKFNPLWQLTEEQKTGVASQVTTMVDSAVAGGIVSQRTALKELRESSQTTGIWTNITDEDIENAADAAPSPGELGMGAEGAVPSNAGAVPGETDDSAPSRAERIDALMTEHAVPRRGVFGKLRETRAQTVGRLMRQNGIEFRHPETRPQRLRRLMAEHGVGTGQTVIHDAYPMREVAGLTVVIETPRGERRAGKNWRVTMPVDYGYVSNTSSEEGGNEQLDCFVGPNEASGMAWALDQLDPATGELDERKLLLGFNSRDEAVAAYRASYDDLGQGRVGDVVAIPVTGLVNWLRDRGYWGGKTAYDPGALNGRTAHADRNA